MPLSNQFITLLLALFYVAQVQAQETESKPHKRLELSCDMQVGMLAGGQIANEQFVYKSGLISQFSVNTRLSPWLQGGIGIGLEVLDTETIIPVFLDFKAQFKPGDKASFIGVNIGSSSGRSTYYKNFADYEYSGGFYFSTYYGLQFPIKNKLKFVLAPGYIHQVGWIEYFTDYNETYLESFSMDFLTIRAGLMF